MPGSGVEGVSLLLSWLRPSLACAHPKPTRRRGSAGLNQAAIWLRVSIDQVSPPGGRDHARSRLPSEPPSQSWTVAAREGVGIRTRSNTVGPVRGNPARTAARNRTVLIDRLPHRTPGRNTAPLIWHRPRAGFRPFVWTSAGVALFPNDYDEPGSGSWPGSRSNQMEHQRIAIASPAQPRAFTALRPLSRE